ncbi:hypothetical protein BH23BAC1_BH23BAC1_12410 [soil metagenome]
MNLLIRFYAAFLPFFFASEIKAQNLIGLANSNYSGTNGLYSNPSSIADSRYGFYFNLITVDFHVNNSFIRYNAPYSIFNLANNLSSGKEVNFEENYLKGKLTGDRKLFSLGAEIRGPSFMFKIDPENSIAITTRFRNAIQVNNISEAVARLILGGTDAPELQDLDFFRKRFALNINSIGEIGISYAKILIDNNESFLKGGFTIKKVAGIYSGHLINNVATYKITEDPFDPTEEIINLDLQGNIGYIENHDPHNAFKLQNWLTGKNIAGSGWGVDLGITYEYRPGARKYSYLMDGKEQKDNSINKYKYKIAIAVLDLGGVKYKGINTTSYDFNVRNKSISLNSFEGVKNSDEAALILHEILEPKEIYSSFSSGLPTALNFNFDYKVKENIYVNTLWMPGLRPKQSVAMRHNSFIAVAPRIEMKHLEFSLPMSMINNYHNFSLGAMVRLGPVIIGSDNMAGLLKLGKPHGANIYTGLSLPLTKGKAKDRDMDGVSDKKDKCPDQKGVLNLAGCPDADMDGIPDHLDECPEAFGLVENKGCPVLERVENYDLIQLTKEENRIINQAFEKLTFENDGVEISSGSIANLNRLADLLLKRPGYKLLIKGQSNGAVKSDLIHNLSLERANAVKDFLIKKGLSEEILFIEEHEITGTSLSGNNSRESLKSKSGVELQVVNNYQPKEIIQKEVLPPPNHRPQRKSSIYGY